MKRAYNKEKPEYYMAMSPSQTIDFPLFSDIFFLQKQYQKMIQDSPAESLNRVLCKRDYLCFALIYKMGINTPEMLKLNFKELKKKLPQDQTWLEQFQDELKMDLPWFHTAKNQSLRLGLSRRGVEKIFQKQREKFNLLNWTPSKLKKSSSLKDGTNKLAKELLKEDSLFLEIFL